MIPLLGPLGMNQGTIRPIIPQNDVITINGIARGDRAMVTAAVVSASEYREIKYKTSYKYR